MFSHYEVKVSMPMSCFWPVALPLMETVGQPASK